MATFLRQAKHAAERFPLLSPFYLQNGYTESPVIVQCYITLRCGLSCPHCLAERNHGQPDDMPLALFDRLCRESADLGVQEMILTGGEPLARPDLAMFVDSLQRHQLSWSLNTATCPTPDQFSSIRHYPPVFVAVSLDGPEKVHNRFRGRADAHAEALRAIRLFSDLPVMVAAGTTVTTRNMGCLDETFDIVRSSGASQWGLHLLIPEGRAKQQPSLFPSKRQLSGLLKTIALKRHLFPVTLCDEMGYAGEWEGYVRTESFYCAAGRAMCAVLPDGSVMPCSTLDLRHTEGNLNDDDLASVWRKGFQKQRVGQLPEKCESCKEKAVCGSGCWLQRQHGAQCFKSLWKMPASVKTAAGVALCAGAMNTTSAQTSAPPDSSLFATSYPPLVFKGVYGSKASPRAPLHPSIYLAMNWLQAVQNADGSWGDDLHKPLLTSMGALALMIQWGNQTEGHRRACEQAIQYLVLQAKKQSYSYLDQRDKSAIIWCLTEAYATTRGSKLPAALLKMPALNDQDPLAWRILAATSLYMSDADEKQNRADVMLLCQIPPASATNLSNQALGMLISARIQGTGATTVRGSAPDPILLIKTSEQPLLDLHLWNAALHETKNNLLGEWKNTWIPLLLQSQQRRDQAGWWDPQNLGMKTGETAGMTASEAKIYATAFLILSFPDHTRRWSSYKPPQPSESTNQEIIIKF